MQGARRKAADRRVFDLEDVVEKSENEIYTEKLNEIFTGTQLVWKSGQNILDELDIRTVWVELHDLIEYYDLSVPKIVEYLKAFNDLDDFLFNQISMNGAILETRMEIDNFLYQSTGMKGIGRCPRCKNDELLQKTTQDRASDEGRTEWRICVNCSYQWKK